MRNRIFISMVMALLLLFTSAGSVAASTITYHPSLVHKTGKMAYEHTKYLTYTVGARVAGSAKEAEARDYVDSQFKRMGYTTTVQPFSYTSRGAEVHSSNVIAYKKGKSSKEIIVGAHYDSVAVGKGSDDNASGVGVMLEVAEVLKKINTPYSIKFIAFGAEEAGLKGSSYYANQMNAQEIENTVGMINLDSLAVGDYMYVYGNAGDKGFIRDQALKIAEKKKLAIGTNSGLNPDYPAGTTGDWSDHAPFKRLGIPYGYFEATNWEAGDMDGYTQTVKHGGVWHTQNDTLEFIEREFPGRVEEHLETFSQALTELLKFFGKTSTSK
ncbi:Zn-dependent exopeptidase M28 [Siminovitchia terrae]|uniref:Zn-dependent exopeptidase M28 n=1 Tax=Siminovitchia terrae TaxID=1914933 RepID=A0ABQ4KUD3_SIMTE|nr:M20/M25/M40 family metallo-hydrolase [Siminovitchia terrae]GIN91566.1 Zn-dependent exopeptidase M28 [Siminovitchia terrae]GIN95656.1 Zn-dependent exopeptidase M28 [Siminovitchia terrae]